MSMSGNRGSRRIPGHKLIMRALALVAALCMAATSAACGAKGAENKADDGSRLSFMLDWTPNTNHVGIDVARHLGYFDKAGLKLTILPTAQAGAETSVQNGVADVGFSKLSNLATFNSQGADLRQVFNIGQHSVARWCSRGLPHPVGRHPGARDASTSSGRCSSGWHLPAGSSR